MSMSVTKNVDMKKKGDTNSGLAATRVDEGPGEYWPFQDRAMQVGTKPPECRGGT
jgi:hypothetical protein